MYRWNIIQPFFLPLFFDTFLRPGDVDRIELSLLPKARVLGAVLRVQSCLTVMSIS